MRRGTMLTALCAACVLAAGAQTPRAVIRVTNPAGVSLRRATVEVPLGDLLPLLGPDSGGIPAVAEPGSPDLPITQIAGSLLLFQADFKSGETREFVAFRRTPSGDPPASLVDGRYVPPREDYAWENDRVAFRMYGPALASEVNNGIDVWTKRVRALVVAKWYGEAEGAPPGKDPYHHDRGEGADFFDVGRSLGAGGSALMAGGVLRQSGVFTSCRTIARGPLRVEFELTYAGVNAGGAVITERKQISLDAGENLNRVRVTYESAAPGTPLTMACGLVKRKGVHLTRDEQACWMGLWGLTNADTVNGSLGTGVVFPPGAFAGFAADSLEWLLTGRARTGEPVTYYAGAGWTRSGDFATENDWNAYLAAMAVRMASPLRVVCAPR